LGIFRRMFTVALLGAGRIGAVHGRTVAAYAAEADHFAEILAGRAQSLVGIADGEAALALEGEMSATIEQSPAKQVQAAMQAAVAAIRTGAQPHSASLTPTLIVAGNLDRAERFMEMK
jgi:ABC-type sugar transport system substrate-binding protein